MRAECGTNILFSRSHQTLKSVINCFDKSSHSKLHPRTTESGRELTRYQPQQQAGEAGVRSSIRRQLRVVTKRCWLPVCWVTDRRPRSTNMRELRVSDGASTVSVTGSVKTGDPGEGQLVNAGLWLVNADPLLSCDWWILGTASVRIGQNVSGLESK